MGFLSVGTHVHTRLHRRVTPPVSPYQMLWRDLHLAAARSATERRPECLIDAIQDVETRLECNICREHLRYFRGANERWLQQDPEFYVFKLHAAANQNARSAGHMASLPPPFGSTVRYWRRELSTLPSCET
jgi:hypothetical protein